jgi:hypothetical protein
MLLAMQNPERQLLIGLTLCVALIYAGYKLRNHLKIQRYLREKSAMVIHPRVGENDASDFGVYLFDASGYSDP